MTALPEPTHERWQLLLLLSGLHRTEPTELEPFGGVPRWLRAWGINTAQQRGSAIELRGQEGKPYRSWSVTNPWLRARLDLPWDHPLLHYPTTPPPPPNEHPLGNDAAERSHWLEHTVLRPLFGQAELERTPSFRLPRQRPGTQPPTCEISLKGTHQWALSLGNHGELPRALSGRDIRLLVLPRDATGARRVLQRSLIDPELCERAEQHRDPGGNLLQQLKSYPAVLALTWSKLRAGERTFTHPFTGAALHDLQELDRTLCRFTNDTPINWDELNLSFPDTHIQPAFQHHVHHGELPSVKELQRALHTARAEAEQVTVRLTGHDPTGWNEIASRFLPIAELRPGQLEMLEHRASNSLVILPTAYGKSVPVTLLSLISAGRHIWITPLRALMNDHHRHLKHHGLTGHAPRSTQPLGPGINLITPERLQGELLADLQRHQPEQFTIDEVHTISELGHDFRPGVLRAIKVWHSLSCPKTGLTGTAPEVVRRDLERTLGPSSALDEPLQITGLQQDGRRDELILNVHICPADVPGTVPPRLSQLEQTLNHDHPALLGLTTGTLYQADNGTTGTLIFTSYADAHASSTADDSAATLAMRVRQILGDDPDQNLNEGRVRIHASKPPTYCPNCESPDYIAENGGNAHCRSCSESFQVPKVAPHWDRTLTMIGSAFDRQEFPVLVATRSYGMGIDRQGIGSVIHHGMSASVESYLQEAGRAARNTEETAACTVIAQLPTNSCRLQLSQSAVPDCVGRACPHGLGSGLCDFGRQARLIEQSFPPVGNEVAKAMKVHNSAGREKDDLATWRLELLGAVNDWLGPEQLQVLQPSKEQLESALRHQGVPIGAPVRSLSDALHLLISTQRQRARTARFEMLMTLLRVLEQRSCRWSAIGAALGWNAEPCGRCDTCRSQQIQAVTTLDTDQVLRQLGHAPDSAAIQAAAQALRGQPGTLLRQRQWQQQLNAAARAALSGLLDNNPQDLLSAARQYPELLERAGEIDPGATANWCLTENVTPPESAREHLEIQRQKLKIQNLLITARSVRMALQQALA